MPDVDSIQGFIDYFRRRVAVARSLGGGGEETGFTPDQAVLVAACFDSLARHWAVNFRPEVVSPARRRMFEFLVQFGDANIFSRVSGPALLDMAVDRGRPDLVPAIRTVFREEPHDTGIKSWREDPVLESVVHHPTLLAAGVEAGWLERSTYGELLYVDFRCSWLHEYAGGNLESRPFLWRDDQGRHEPHYSNTTAGHFSVNRRLVLPPAFLFSTLDDVLDRFETSFLEAGIFPGGGS